jgi:putative transposase
MIRECAVDIDDDRKQARSLRGIAERLWSVAIPEKRVVPKCLALRATRCSETGMSYRFWLEFSAMIPRLRGAKSDEGIEVFGGADGVHSQAGLMGCRWQHLPQGRIIQATYFNWKKKYGGLLPSEMRRLKQLEDENAKLRKVVADLSLDKEMLQELRRKPRSLSGSVSSLMSAWPLAWIDPAGV